MDAVTNQPVQIDGQCRNKGLALAGLHLGNPAPVQCCTAHQLNVVVPLANHPMRGFANRGERVHHQVVGALPIVEASAKFVGLGFERVVTKGHVFGAQCVHGIDDVGDGFQPLAVARLKDLVEKFHPAGKPTAARAGGCGRWLRSRLDALFSPRYQ